VGDRASYYVNVGWHIFAFGIGTKAKSWQNGVAANMAAPHVPGLSVRNILPFLPGANPSSPLGPVK
jgi:hypothetical protein